MAAEEQVLSLLDACQGEPWLCPVFCYIQHAACHWGEVLTQCTFDCVFLMHSA